MPVIPFRGWRYCDPTPQTDPGVMDLSSVLTPYPYVKTVSPGLAADALLDSSGVTAADAERTWQSWVSNGIVAADPDASLYLYRSGWKRDGRALTSTGVLALLVPGNDDGFATGSGAEPHVTPTVVRVPHHDLTALLTPPTMPLARGTDASGSHHRLWALQQHGVIDAITQLAEVALKTSTTRTTTGLLAITADSSPPPLGLVFGRTDTSE